MTTSTSTSTTTTIPPPPPPTTTTTPTQGNSNENVERRCENADCLVGDLVSRIPKRKTPQFIVNPTIIDKPLLVSNFNSVFQIDGISAKLSDINNADGNKMPPNTIYRIIPNTHAHIVNYVVVDDDGEALRKLNASDPATITKLLKSQVASAQKMLHKLMTEQGTMVNVSYNNKSDGVTTTTTTTTTPSAATTFATATTTTTTGGGGTTTTTTSTTAEAAVNITNENITLKKTNNLKTYTAKNNILETSITKAKTTITPTAKTRNLLPLLPTLATSSAVTKLPTKPRATPPPPPTHTTTTTTTTTGDIGTLTGTEAISRSFRLSSQIKVTRKILPARTTSTTTTTITTTTTLPTITNSTTTTTTSTPLIKTVPLSQLQKPSVLQNRPFTTTITPARTPMPTSFRTTTTTAVATTTTTQGTFSSSSSSAISATSPIILPPSTTTIVEPTDDSISIEKMKKELDELRQTVAALAANQAKTVGVNTIIQPASSSSSLSSSASKNAVNAVTQPRPKRARLEKP